MTATPREPTREEVEDALTFADTIQPPEAYIKVLAAAYRNLLAQAPKVWTADAIQDAPEGMYRLGCEVQWVPNNEYSKAEIIRKFGNTDGIWDRGWGPLPQPPPPEEKGG